MNPDKEVLQEAHCWFNADRVPGDPEMTEFKREARYRQALWRERRSLGLGSHPNTAKAIDAGGPATKPNGSKIDEISASKGANFLSRAIRRSVADRLANHQEHEMLGVKRLQEDLLSSMPMCFNLFGELSADQDRARRTAELLFPDAAPGPVEVKFEWSPKRRCQKYTNDRTAFDVALVIGSEGGSKQIIGIETKYHEHAVREAAPKAEQRDHFESQLRHYMKIAEASQCFKPGWEDAVLGSELRQIWRDHLLLLSMLQHKSEWSGGRYVLAYPERNVSFARASENYRQVLVDGDQTFSSVTIESLLRAGVLHCDATAAAFEERYLW